eukprot:Platyproteum_vivax@DN4507_c0_g1_i1.p1
MDFDRTLNNLRSQKARLVATSPLGLPHSCECDREMMQCQLDRDLQALDEMTDAKFWNLQAPEVREDFSRHLTHTWATKQALAEKIDQYRKHVEATFRVQLDELALANYKHIESLSAQTQEVNRKSIESEALFKRQEAIAIQLEVAKVTLFDATMQKIEKDWALARQAEARHATWAAQRILCAHKCAADSIPQPTPIVVSRCPVSREPPVHYPRGTPYLSPPCCQPDLPPVCQNRSHGAQYARPQVKKLDLSRLELASDRDHSFKMPPRFDIRQPVSPETHQYSAYSCDSSSYAALSPPMGSCSRRGHHSHHHSHRQVQLSPAESAMKERLIRERTPRQSRNSTARLRDNPSLENHEYYQKLKMLGPVSTENRGGYMRDRLPSTRLRF